MDHWDERSASPAEISEPLKSQLLTPNPVGKVTRITRSKHFHSPYEVRFSPYRFILFILKGQATLTSPEHRQEVLNRKGDLVLYAPNTWHTLERSAHCSIFRVSIRPDEIHVGYRRSPSIPLLVHTLPRVMGEWASGTFDRVLSHPLPENERRALATMLLREMVGLLERSTCHPSSKAHQTWRMLREYVETNCHRPLTRSCVGQVLRIHPGHISRLYQQFSKQSFQQNLEACRLARASALLRESPELNVAEIAAICGFSSHSYFSRIFRKAHGMSPITFREANRAVAPGNA